MTKGWSSHSEETSIPYGPLNPLEVIPDCRVRSKPWALPSVSLKAPPPNKKN